MPEYGIKSLFGPRGLLQRLAEDEQNEQLLEFAERTAQLIEDGVRDRVPGPHFDDRPRKHLKYNVNARVVRTEKGRFEIWVGMPEHGIFADQGTGIWGPKGAPIRAKTAKGMRLQFAPGQWRVAQSVQGQPGQNFMRRGRDAAIRIARRRYGKLIEKA